MVQNFTYKLLTENNIFQMDGYCVWDGSITQAPDGTWCLFFSRWPLAEGFDAWVTHSEAALAVSDSPTGPYRFEKVLFNKRAGFWDGDIIHNPQIHVWNNKYYLLYNGNHGDGEWFTHRNNQRVGIAVADDPFGKWKRFDKPILDVTADAWDSLVTTNPTCTKTPEGKFLMIYKGVGQEKPLPFGGPVLHGVALSDNPTGPYKKNPEPIFATEGDLFPGEDPFVWRGDNMYYALLKDMKCFYTEEEKAIVLFESYNGIDWELSNCPVVKNRILSFDNGTEKEVYRLERPFMSLDNNKPKYFVASIKPYEEKEESNIAIWEVI